ncbi:tellurium resistance protein TerC [Niastella yeongjuensis]|uniref:Tellurium resistance protein TerC n=1 Tax=Niastella yeongjuensis TaxID=354355 RepID=A0A1V9ELW5_9BACT|nr:TerC/Alx family metal homeostasis membrane protein [Niastella yeongjuensis]OQP47129.1 tellurium resistance protein TerC [Niastella yeongjuensis]SEN70968.1 tellurite resistance protein TerC [Niastella yeongjuensis]
MTAEQITFITFGILLVVALAFDLGLLSKKTTQITIKKALWQTAFWVSLALAFFVFVWVQNGHERAIKYVSAYLMEWSLSIDNIFVFILIFQSFKVRDKFYGRVLLIGILMAIIFRIIFIAIGIELVERFHFILYIFGAFLVYTGFNMFKTKHDEDEEAPNMESNKVYKLLKRVLPLTPEDGDGKWSIRKEGKKLFTSLFVVVIILGTTDILFALDSIPAVFTLAEGDKLVIYTSNIFAVLGLRSLFFLLQGAKDKFGHLQHGIAIILIFIGLKMLLEDLLIKYAGIKEIPIYVSLLVIVTCILASIIYSINVSNRAHENGKGPDAGIDREIH